MSPPRVRLYGGVLLAVYALFLAVVLLDPSPAMASGAVTDAARVLDRLGVPLALVTRSRIEFVLNALMGAPLAFGGRLLWRRWSWTGWTTAAFVVAGVVELGQGLFLPARSAQFVDVVANTAGALLGAAAAELLTALRLRHRQPAPATFR